MKMYLLFCPQKAKKDHVGPIIFLLALFLMLFIINFANAKSTDRLNMMKRQTDEALKMSLFNNRHETIEAKEINDQAENLKESDESIFSKTLKSVLILATLLAILILSLYLIKNYLYGKKKFGKSKKWISIRDTIYIAPKQSLSLIEIEGKRLLIGITQNNMTTLAQMEIPIQETSQEEEKEKEKEKKQTIEKENSSFTDILKNLQNNLNSLKKV